MLQAFLLGLGLGIAATPHCLGMCGGFPLHLARSSGRGGVIARQVLFIAGKGFTYIFLGALASALGVIVFKNTRIASGAIVFRVAVGALIIIIGLGMLGFRFPRLKKYPISAETGFVRALFAGLLTSPSPIAALVLGLGVGFLPCPLPMGALAVAAAAHNLPYGMSLMAGVGLGTAPGLVALGVFGVGLDRKFARIGMRAAGVVVLVLGLLTVARATGIIHAKHPINRAIPPCCVPINQK